MRKTFKLGKGLKLTLSGSGLSMTVGGRGNSVHFGNKGVYRNVSIPGLGSSRRKISGGNNYDNEDYTVNPIIAPPPAPDSGSGSFSQMNAVALKIEAEKKSAPEVKTDNRPLSFLQFLKFIICCCMLFIALVFLLGSISDAKNNKSWLCFCSAFFIAGCLVMNAAKRKNLEGSGFSWFCYGALIPIVSWIDVTMANSQSKIKGFMKGLTISIIGIVAFLAVFVQII
ncbi:MAG: DUF4236 domain-containing protein [Synergistaceae bacterium]|nr:DUF4236 domain-containing protein [Synergistaceae bacterium]